MTLRAAHVDESLALANLHVDVWRKTYVDLATPEALAKLDTTHRLPLWQSYLEDKVHHVFVEHQNGAVIGVVCIGPSSHEAFGNRQEIKHLYVAGQAARQGVGARLLNAALAQCTKDGHKGAGLAVVTQNHPARSFYVACGGVEMGEFVDPGPLWKSANTIVVWDL